MAGDQPLGDAAMVGNVRARCEDREEGAVEVGDAGDERRRSGAEREVLLESVPVAVEKARARLVRSSNAAMIGRARGDRRRGLTDARASERIVFKVTSIGKHLGRPATDTHEITNTPGR